MRISDWSSDVCSSDLAPHGIAPDAIPTAFNIFMNVPVGADGRIKVAPPTTAPGDFIRLRALAALIVGLTACSAYDSCGGTLQPIHYAIEACGLHRVETRRASGMEQSGYEVEIAVV